MIELMVVMAIIAISASLIAFALPDGTQRRLDEEASRLAALLDSARAQSRASGVTVRWEPQGAAPSEAVGAAPSADFRFVGLPVAGSLPTRWLNAGVSAEVIGARALLLGPEPIIGAQRIVLRMDDRRAVLATDGIGSFTPIDEAAP